jgi:uncharacterized protein DUF2690
MKLKIVSILTIMFTAFAVATVVAPSAARASTCYGSGCSGQDPNAQGCSSGAGTIDRATAPGGIPTVELRLGYGCGAAWARGNHYWANVLIEGSPDASTVTVRYGVVYSCQFGCDYTYTDMIDFGLYVRACVQAFASDQWACTSWH